MQTSGESLVHCIINLIGNLLPLIIGLLYYATVAPEWKGWDVFYGEGQFYLYAATLLTTTGFVYYSYAVKITDKNSIITLLAVLFLFLISLLYAWKLAVANFSKSLLFWTSVVPFILSVPFYYFATRMVHRYADPLAYKRDALDELMKPVNQKKRIDKIVNVLPDQ